MTTALTDRFHYLDGLRGIAALSVVLYHINIYLDFTQSSFKSHLPLIVLNIFANGHSAVALFFVMSGFVLSFKYFQQKSNPDYLPFLVQRGFRLYPVFWAVLLVTILCQITELPPLQSIFSEASLLVEPSTKLLIFPAWSLFVEMKYSIIIPLLIVAMRQQAIYGLGFVGFLLLISQNFWGLHFVAGMYLAYYYPQILQIKLITWQKITLFVLGALLYVTENILMLCKLPVANLHDFYMEHYTLIAVLSGLGSLILIFLVLKERFLQQLLGHRYITYLGTISYSMYIVHIVVQLQIFDRLFGVFLPFIKSHLLTHCIVYYGLSVPFTILVSHFLYHYVEMPFIKIGKDVVKKYFK
jgi:peptidoglycan/LPS O-acetylase OafA/YrhL